MIAVLGITEATLPWIVMFTAILVGSAGGLAFLATVVRDRWREWRHPWQWDNEVEWNTSTHGATFEELLGSVPGALELVDDEVRAELLEGSDGVWFTDMLKELE